MVVVIAVALGSGVACGGYALAGGFVGEVAADFGEQIFVAGEEDSLVVLAEAGEVAGGAFG